jgi:hypothetical protein
MSKISQASGSQPTPHAAGRPDFSSLVRAMNLQAHRTERAAQNELYRLRRRGLIHWRPRRMEWTLTPDHAQGISDVAAGRAFTVYRLPPTTDV